MDSVNFKIHMLKYYVSGISKGDVLRDRIPKEIIKNKWHKIQMMALSMSGIFIRYRNYRAGEMAHGLKALIVLANGMDLVLSATLMVAHNHLYPNALF